MPSGVVIRSQMDSSLIVQLSARADVRSAAVILEIPSRYTSAAVTRVWNAIDGLTALVAGDFVVADAERVVALRVAAWGWVLLALGVVEVIAGIALFIGARWARVVAVLVAGFQRVAHLALLAAYPVRAILIMIASALVIWTVLDHGDAARV